MADRMEDSTSHHQDMLNSNWVDMLVYNAFDVLVGNMVSSVAVGMMIRQTAFEIAVAAVVIAAVMDSGMLLDHLQLLGLHYQSFQPLMLTVVAAEVDRAPSQAVMEFVW